MVLPQYCTQPDNGQFQHHVTFEFCFALFILLTDVSHIRILLMKLKYLKHKMTCGLQSTTPSKQLFKMIFQFPHTI